MNPDPSAIRQVIRNAWQALQNGDHAAAQRWAEMAAAQSPEMEEPWLILAGLVEPHLSVEYLENALRINPFSERARKGMQWAVERLREEKEKEGEPDRLGTAGVHVVSAVNKQVPAPDPSTAAATQPVRILKQAPIVAAPEPNPSASTQLVRTSKRAPIVPAPRSAFIRWGWLLLPLVGLILCTAVLGTILLGNVTPALAFLRGNGDAAPVTPTLPGAAVEVAKPTYTPSLTPTSTSTPTATATNTPTYTPTFTPTDTPSPTRVPTNTPLSYETPIPYIPPVSDNPCRGGTQARWINIDLSDQMLYACEYGSTEGSFLVSTGTYLYPTVTGDFHIYLKLLSARMTGPGYDLPNVPYTMYFYGDYGIHGTYWHSNFGTPMSHGCVNMRTLDAQWLYYWASEGTLVHIHY